MFKKKPTQPPPPGSDEFGLLGLDSEFKGNIRFQGTLRLDGLVEGDISSEEGSGTVLVVNRQARVLGDIIADSVLISGMVHGNIVARERVEIYRTGTLKGNVSTGDFMVQAGAEFQGQCKMAKKVVARNKDKKISESQEDVKPAAAGKTAPAGTA